MADEEVIVGCELGRLSTALDRQQGQDPTVLALFGGATLTIITPTSTLIEALVELDAAVDAASPGLIPEALTILGTISPPQIVVNQNDYAPASFATSTVLRLNTDSSRDMTGLGGGSAGRTILIFNVGSFDLVLKDQNVSSAAVNRFALGGSDFTLLPSGSMNLWYDATSTRWRPF